MSGPGGGLELVAWLAYLREIGVRELAVPRAAPGPTPVGVPPAAARRAVASPPGCQQPQPALGLAVEEWEDLAAIRESLGDCRRCRLHEGRTQIVFGTGDPRAGLMFVGEGPGAEEDARGEPFVGKAGRKLDQMIEAIGLRREQVYIANVVKCRPPDNRTPLPDEVATCSPFLFRQILAIRPKVIVALGSPATRTLLGTTAGITRLRGTWHDFHGIPVMPTFHPAYLLRAYTKENRARVWDDLRAARERLDAAS